MQDRTHDGRAFRLLTIIDEFTRECLAIDVDRRLSSDRVLERLTELLAQRRAPDCIRADACVRPDSGTEFTARKVRQWLANLSVRTHGVAPATPKQRVSGCRSSSRGACGSLIRRENGYVESFNGKLRDELLDGEILDTLREAQVLVARWRKHYTGRAFGSSRETAQLTGVSSPGPGGAPALGSGLRSAEPSTQGCLTGRSIPHYNSYHPWGQVNTTSSRRSSTGPCN